MVPNRDVACFVTKSDGLCHSKTLRDGVLCLQSTTFSPEDIYELIVAIWEYVAFHLWAEQWCRQKDIALVDVSSSFWVTASWCWKVVGKQVKTPKSKLKTNKTCWTTSSVFATLQNLHPAVISRHWTSIAIQHTLESTRICKLYVLSWDLFWMLPSSTQLMLVGWPNAVEAREILHWVLPSTMPLSIDILCCLLQYPCTYHGSLQTLRILNYGVHGRARTWYQTYGRIRCHCY